MRAGMRLRITFCVSAGVAMIASSRAGQKLNTAFPSLCDRKPSTQAKGPFLAATTERRLLAAGAGAGTHSDNGAAVALLRTVQ